MKISVRVVLIAGLMFAGSVQDVAADRSPWTRHDTWTKRSEGKLAYGLKNLLLGWTELVTEPDESISNADINILRGLWDGVWNSVTHTIGGGLHVLTFPVTSFDIPLPDGGVGWDRDY